MCHPISSKITFLVLVLCYQRIGGVCRHSYFTFCDNFSDLDNQIVDNLTDLVIGSESSDASQMGPINYDTISIDRFVKLKTLIILGRVNDIKTYTFSIDPEEVSLDFLKLDGNDIRRLRYSTFDSIKIGRLSFTNNNLEYIQKDAFYNCDFKTLDLSNNKLEMVESGVFTDETLANTTEELILKFNRLESIEPNSFPNSLKILNLDYNSIKVLQYPVFNNLCHLQELTISHNKLDSIPNVKNLKEIIVLDFSYNNLISVNIKDFNELSNLEVLDLSYNKIVNKMAFELFKFPQRHPSLQISLAFNHLTHLVLANDSFRDHIVFLYGNPWNCKCWEILEKFMVDNKVKRNECDMKYFGNGEIPYCVHYLEDDCNRSGFKKNPNFTKNDLSGFLDVIEKNKAKINCNLKPRRL